MTLTIHRMHTRLRTADVVEPHRLAAWQDAFRAQDGDRIAARWAGAEEWLLIRRLPLHLRWRGDPVDTEVGRAWGDALEQAIARAMERDDGNCVRYANRQEALADLVYRAALGDTGRDWAWQRMGLIPQAGWRSEEVLRHACAELARTPELVWPVLMRLVTGEERTACLTAALRALPLAAWLRLFEACPRTAGFARALAASPARTAQAAAPQATIAWSRAALALLQWAAARGWFVRKHADVLTVLLCACQHGAHGLSPARCEQQVSAARARLALPQPAVPLPPAARTHAVNARTASPAANVFAAPAQQPATPADAQPQPRMPELSQPQHWLHTRFAGALFWLARVEPSGLLDALEDSDEGVRLLLHALGRALGVPADDAVLLAFCGGALPTAEPSPATLAAAERVAAEWERWLARKARELPEPRVLAVCQRPGRLRMEPGWIELHLSLDQVDTAIRRLALDLDPGWLPWLGCVVRIVYETP